MLTYNNVKQFIFYWLNCKFATCITNLQDLKNENFMAYKLLFLMNVPIAFSGYRPCSTNT